MVLLDAGLLCSTLQLDFHFSMEKQWKNKEKTFFVSRSRKRKGKGPCFSRGTHFFFVFPPFFHGKMKS